MRFLAERDGIEADVEIADEDFNLSTFVGYILPEVLIGMRLGCRRVDIRPFSEECGCD